MAKSVLERLRQQRRSIIHWVIAALVLPVLLGLLPQPALSEAAALERDLASFTCSLDPAGAADRENGSRHSQHDQCILCASGCPVCAPVLLGGVPSAALPRLKQAHLQQPADHITAILRGVLRQGSPPRAPPLSLNV